jgi:8-hydroxy-5-deazaflavin:NADPH oxidoreductase
LESRGTPEGTPGRVCLSVAGDEPADKQVVLRLLGELGFDGLDAGSLAESGRQQPGTPAYCMDLDRTSLQTALSQPDAAGVARRRQTADEQARRSSRRTTPAHAEFRQADVALSSRFLSIGKKDSTQ